MNQFFIHEAIFNLFPESVYGVIIAENVNNACSNNEIFTDLLRKAETESLKHIELEPFILNPVVAEWREVFSKFKTKKGARASIEAMLKRISKGEHIGSINPLVDIYNSVALKYGLSVGATDIDTFKGSLRIAIADGNETFSVIGSEENDPPFPGEIIYKDDAGAVTRCFSWRDAQRTRTTENTRNAFLMTELLSQSRKDYFYKALDELESLVTLHLGAETTRYILDKSNPRIEF